MLKYLCEILLHLNVWISDFVFCRLTKVQLCMRQLSLAELKWFSFCYKEVKLLYLSAVIYCTALLLWKWCISS